MHARPDTEQTTQQMYKYKNFGIHLTVFLGSAVEEYFETRKPKKLSYIIRQSQNGLPAYQNKIKCRPKLSR